MEGTVDQVPRMTQQEQSLLGKFIEKEFGVQMPPVKRVLLQSRLAKRVSAYGLKNFKQYFEFVTGPDGVNEFLVFTDLVTTHETSFFREKKHFQILESEILPTIIPHDGRKIEVLCAACSSGEEAYSIALSIASVLDLRRVNFDSFFVEGIDLSSKIIEIARRGVYSNDRVHHVPPLLCQKYFMHSRNPHTPVHRVVPELRNCMLFHAGNLLGDLNTARQHYDLIFCRNVLIYFNRENQSLVVSKLLSRLAPGGYLFLGHAETMIGTLLELTSPFHAVYRRAV